MDLPRQQAGARARQFGLGCGAAARRRISSARSGKPVIGLATGFSNGPRPSARGSTKAWRQFSSRPYGGFCRPPEKSACGQPQGVVQLKSAIIHFGLRGSVRVASCRAVFLDLLLGGKGKFMPRTYCHGFQARGQKRLFFEGGPFRSGSGRGQPINPRLIAVPALAAKTTRVQQGMTGSGAISAVERPPATKARSK